MEREIMTFKISTNLSRDKMFMKCCLNAIIVYRIVDLILLVFSETKQLVEFMQTGIDKLF